MSREKDEFDVKEQLRRMADSELRSIVKEAVRELLNEYASRFGWFSLKTIGLALLSAGLIFILWAQKAQAAIVGWVR